MRPGFGALIFGIALLGLGIAVTILSKAVYWYGAIIVGVYWIVRGIFRLAKPPDPTDE